MEPRPDGRGKRGHVCTVVIPSSWPQWSPGLMAGGSKVEKLLDDYRDDTPQWSPGLMAGVSWPTLRRGPSCTTRRNGAPA